MSTSSLQMRQRAFRTTNAVRTAGSQRVSRARLTVQAGFFDFLKPAAAAPKQNARARELVDELLELCVPTDAGLKVSPPLRERIEELAEELSQYCIRNPVKSPLLWGEYEVVYSANPGAIAGPFRKGVGLTVFPGQKAKQVLQAPNVFINDLSYKTLGFLDGYARQFGEIEFTSGSTFKVVINRQELDTGAGLKQEKAVTSFRNFEVIYLDDDVRVTRFLPVAGLRDDERDEKGEQKELPPPSLFVFKRVKVEEEVEEEPAARGGGASSSEESAVGTAFAGLRLPGTLGRKRLEGAATLTERQVRRQMEEDNRRGRGGSAQIKPRPGTASLKPPRSGTVGTRPSTPEPKRAAAAAKKEAEARKKQEAEAKKREAARAAAEKQKQEKEAAAAQARKAKEAAAEKERRAKEAAAENERREAEAAAAREKQAAIRNLLAQLGQELKDKAAAKKDALLDLKAVERSNSNVLRAAAAARSKVEAAVASTGSAEAALADAKQAQQEAVAGLKGAEAELKEVAKGTQKVLAGTARTRR